MRGLARRALRKLPERQQLWLRRYRNARRPLPQLSIGLLTGDSPWTLKADPRYPSPIISAGDVTDADAAFVADPFAYQRDGVWHLFFEVMNRGSGKGEIALATSTNLVDWFYQKIVLAEAFHLSYPAIYETAGEVWMVPESWEAKQVRLYRADPFPFRWVLHQILLDDMPGTDPTVFQNDDGSWSMLLCDARSTHNSTLLVFDAPEIRGPWTQSAQSPLVADKAEQARPGGHCFVVDGRRYRLGQDCSRRYGERLRSFPMPDDPSEAARDVLSPTGRGWRALGGHHADLHAAAPGKGWLAFVDGEA